MKRRKRSVRIERHRRKRDYRREYRQRIKKGLAQGLSRSQARGHARAGESLGIRPSATIDVNDPRERALGRVKRGESMKAAAKAERISPERLRRYVRDNVRATRHGRKWQIVDRRGVEMALCSLGKFRWVRVSTEKTSAIGHFWVGVDRFLRTNDTSHLAPFQGVGIRDVSGKLWPFETRPNVLRRLDSAGELSFLEIYKNVA